MRHHPLRILLLFAALPLLSGCMTGAASESSKGPTIEPVPTPLSDAAPLWIDDPDASFPNDRYLAAVGSGDSRASAEKAAYAALAARIIAEVRARQRRVDAQTTLAEQSRRASSMRSDIAIDSSAILVGARIAETWTDPDSNERYAVAIMSRDLAGEAYRRELRAAVQSARAALSRADEAASALESLAHLDDAVKALTEIESLRAALAAVRRLGPVESIDVGADLPSPSETRAQMATLRRSLGVAIEPNPDLPPRIESILSDALVGAGVPLLISGDPKLLLAASYATEPAPSYAENRAAVRWTLRVELLDASRSRVLDALSLDGAAVGPTPTAARGDAAAAARRALQDAINRFLQHVFYDPTIRARTP